MELTAHDITQIMQMYRDSIDLRIIANNIGISQASVSNIIRAFNGSESKLSLLKKQHQSLIKELSPFYTNEREFTTKSDIYVCELFFGMIKIKFKPKKQFQ